MKVYGKKNMRFVCLVAIIGALFTPYVFSSAFDDRDIEAAINAELLFDNAVMANRIDVNCKEGVVTLSGEARSILERERAEQQASATMGVRSIVNLIQVNPRKKYADDVLEQRVLNALARDPAADAFELMADAENGVVTLEGEVESYAERELSGIVAKGTDGVVELNNHIVVNYASERTDHEIKADVVKRLENDVRVNAHFIDVSASNGVVSLTGSVGSIPERNLAYAKAWVAGVGQVDTDGLEVLWMKRDEMHRAAAHLERSDSEVADAVRDALRYDPRVDAADIEVGAVEGMVRLSGVVDNSRAKNAVLQDARNTWGVKRVTDLLKVRPEPVADAELEKRVVQRLEQDALVNRSDIAVDVDDGWVTLTGDVATSYEKSQAELAMHAVKGVQGVVNRIDYDRIWYWMPDPDLREAVREQLSWSVFTDLDDLDVGVTNGLVTLRGTVDSWGEYYDAEQNAYEAGAKHVDNELEVDPVFYYEPFGTGYPMPYSMGGFYVPNYYYW